jgi:hypothetical protein
VLYFHSEGRHAADFVTLKNPLPFAGFEPVNLGSNDKHTVEDYSFRQKIR